MVERGNIVGYEGDRRKLLIVDDQDANRQVAITVLSPPLLAKVPTFDMDL